MQSTAFQQYLARPNENLIYYFFLRNDRTLYCNIYNKNNILLNSGELISDAINFSVTADKHEKIHLVCITSKGELQHYINENNDWIYRTVSKLDIKSNIYKYLTLHVDNEYTHIFYIKINLLTQNLSAIKHMYWNEKNVNRIVVNNYIHGKYAGPPQVSSDRFENFHIVYKVFYKNNHQLYYNRFNTSTKIWTVNELISDLQEEHSHPYIFIDKRQNLHLIWCTIEQNNFILRYKKRDNITDTRSKWSDIQTLSDRNSNYLFPILIQESNILKIYCKQNDKIIEIMSEDFGDSWLNSTEGRSYDIKGPEIIRYSGNPQIDDRYLAKHVYGYVRDTVRIIGMNLFNNEGRGKPIVQPAPDHKQNLLVNKRSDIDEGTDVDEKNDIDEKTGADEKTDVGKENGIDEKTDTDKESDTDKEENTIIREINYTKYETGEDINKIIDLDKIDNISNRAGKHGNIIGKLISDYDALEKQFSEIKEKKRKFTETMNNYEANLNLLEEEIMNYKKQMFVFREKFDDIISNNNIFRRFINFLK